MTLNIDESKYHTSSDPADPDVWGTNLKNDIAAIVDAVNAKPDAAVAVSVDNTAGTFTVTGAGATVDADTITYGDSGATAYTKTAVDALMVNVRNFGAIGDGSHDDTTAIQAALDATPSGIVFLPAGTYKITAPLLIRPVSFAGLRVRGAGRPAANLLGGNFTYIRQDGGNVPIFKFTVSNVENCHFADFGVGYASPSGTGNTGQTAFLFDGATAGTLATWFEHTFERLSVLNAYDMFAVSGTSPSVWGSTWADIMGSNIQHDCFRLSTASPVGQPINTFRDIYINNANGSVVSTGYIFRFVAVEATMSGLDLEGWTNAIYNGGGGYSTNMEGVHIEHHKVDGTTTGDYHLFSQTSGNLSIRNISVSGTSLGGSFALTAIVAAQTGACVTIDDLTMAWSSAVGILCIADSAGGTYRIGPNRLGSGVAYTLAYNAAALAKITGSDGTVTRTGQLLGTRGAVPTAVAGANNGTTPPVPVVASTDTAVRGNLTFGSGTTPAAGAQCVATFDAVYPAAPVVTLSPRNAATAALGLYVSATAPGSFTIASTAAPTAAQANTVYSVDYAVIG